MTSVDGPDAHTRDEYRKVILATACDSYQSGKDDPTTVSNDLTVNWAINFAGGTVSIPLDLAYDSQVLATDVTEDAQNGDTQKEGVAILCYAASQA